MRNFVFGIQIMLQNYNPDYEISQILPYNLGTGIKKFRVAVLTVIAFNRLLKLGKSKNSLENTVRYLPDRNLYLERLYSVIYNTFQDIEPLVE